MTNTTGTTIENLSNISDEIGAFHFTLEQCELAAIHGQTSIKCMKENSMVDVKSLIPDLLLCDKEDLHIDFADLEFTKKLGDGKKGIFWEFFLLISGIFLGAFGVISEANYQGKSYAVKQITKTTDEEKLEAFREWYNEVCAMR